MKKKWKYVVMIILTLVIFVWISRGEDITEYIQRKYKIDLPKADNNEILLSNTSFGDITQFQISKYNNPLSNDKMSGLKEITKDNVMDVKLEYVRIYDTFTEEERKVIDKYFDRNQKIVEGNFYFAENRIGECMFILYDSKESKIYYLLWT